MQRFWTTAQLLGRGRTERDIRTALETGLLEPVRKGHHAARGTPPELIRAARVGGVLTGPSAVRALGLWTPPDPGASALDDPGAPDRLHVAVARRAHRLRDPDDEHRALGARTDVVVHRADPAEVGRARRTGIAGILLVLEHVVRSLPPERALAVLDSALHERHLATAELPALAARLPARLRPLLAQADARAESGLETIARYLLRLAGLRVEVLVRLRDVGTVDLLVEGRLVVELDGRAFHRDAAAFARDRARDLTAAVDRYRTLRFTWFQVLFEWPRVEAAVLAALATR